MHLAASRGFFLCVRALLAAGADKEGNGAVRGPHKCGAANASLLRVACPLKKNNES